MSEPLRREAPPSRPYVADAAGSPRGRDTRAPTGGAVAFGRGPDGRGGYGPDTGERGWGGSGSQWGGDPASVAATRRRLPPLTRAEEEAARPSRGRPEAARSRPEAPEARTARPPGLLRPTFTPAPEPPGTGARGTDQRGVGSGWETSRRGGDQRGAGDQGGAGDRRGAGQQRGAGQRGGNLRSVDQQGADQRSVSQRGIDQRGIGQRGADQRRADQRGSEQRGADRRAGEATAVYAADRSDARWYGSEQYSAGSPYGGGSDLDPADAGAATRKFGRGPRDPRGRGGDPRRPRRPRWGSLQGGLGVCMILAGAAVGAVASVATNRAPGTVLGAFIVVGTVVAAFAVRPRAGRMIFPVPVLAYLVAALVAGVVYDRGDGLSRAQLAVDAAQWIASGFFAMAAATVLGVLIITVRWLLIRRRRPQTTRDLSYRGPRRPYG